MVDERYIRCGKATASVLLVCLGFIVPFITEAIVVGLNYGTPLAYWIILLCSIIQSPLALYMGAKLIYDTHDHKGNCIDIRDCDAVWCLDITEFATLTKGSYILYALPVWFATNVICTWVNLGATNPIPLAMHLFSYLPIVTALIGLGIGLGMSRTLKSEYVSI